MLEPGSEVAEPGKVKKHLTSEGEILYLEVILKVEFRKQMA